MKNTLRLLSPIFITLLVAGCFGNKSNKSTGPNVNPDDYQPEYVGDPDPVITDSTQYLSFWDHKSQLSINISMSRQAAEFINNYQFDHDDSTYFDYYVPCTFTLNMNNESFVFEEAGIRGKGNMSRRHCLTDGQFSLQSLVHFKVTFKETFDDDEYTSIEALQPFKKDWSDDSEGRKARKARRLFDMEKIDLKWNRNDDQSKSKQAFAIHTFRNNGVLAGRSTLANTTIGISGESSINTTYEILECIDDVFIKRHFNESHASGDLYKCTYTNIGQANFSGGYTVGLEIGVEKNKTGYHPVYDLKTNKKTSDHSNLLKLIQTINDRTSSAADYKEKVSKVMYMDEFIKYEGIAYLAGNFDDLRNNANNYYLYFESTTNIAHIIPYDFDRCFGMGTEGRKNYMTDFSPESTKMQCNGDWQNMNIYWRTICSSSSAPNGFSKVVRVEDYRALYQETIERMLNYNVISVESFNDFVNEFPASYRGSASGEGEGNTSFSHYLELKKQAIKSNTPKYNI